MLHVIRHHFKAILFMLVLAIFTLLNVMIVWTSTIAQEQNQNDNMRQRLEAIQARIETEVSFHVTFRFVEPLMDTGEVVWEIPYFSEADEIDRGIGEIGDDFICFYERAGSAYGVRCTPFSNIAAFTYLEN